MSVAPPPMFYPPLPEEEKHLRLISIFHYVVGGLYCFGGLFALIYVGLGIFFLNATPASLHSRPGEPPPELLGWLFVGIGAFGFLLAETFGICTIVAGRKLAQRTAYRFAFVVACCECIMFPLGTILGVFTLITLSKESVKMLFRHGRALSPLPAVPSARPPLG